MNAVNQPENTTTSNVRDAAVQIGDEDKGLLIKELFHVEPVAEVSKGEGLLGPQALALAQLLDKTPKEKTDFLMEGFCKAAGGAGRFDRDKNQLFEAFVKACITIDRLTSSNKFMRDCGKKRVREMVKLGKGE